jgi:hypothetical protein
MSMRYSNGKSRGRTLAQWRQVWRLPRLAKSLLRALLHLAWVSLLVWLLWNDAISGFLGAGQIDAWKAVGLGLLVAIVAWVFRDAPAHATSPAEARRR